jgi:glycosyltransferase involved in cell wall biosynthesis
MANQRAPGVTVVLPVYNAGEGLVRCLKTLESQDLAHESFEVVAVDDGSTDRSAQRLESYAASHPNVRVFHQDASGGPGGPRNVGTDHARGEFVFYLDADDGLVDDALRRMLTFAREHASDLVVVGRVTVEDDRVVYPLAPEPPLIDAPLRTVFTSLTPHKLIRRELIVKHGIRFREGRVTWEDGIFLAELAPRARRISTLQDRAYYIKHREPTRRSARFYVRPKARAAVEMVEILRRLDADPAEVDIIAFTLYRRLLQSWNAPRFLRMSQHEQELLISTMRKAAIALVPPVHEAKLRYRLHVRSLAFRTGRLPVVIALVESERDNRWGARARHPLLLPILVRAWLAAVTRRVPRAAVAAARRQAATRHPRGSAGTHLPARRHCAPLA